MLFWIILAVCFPGHVTACHDGWIRESRLQYCYRLIDHHRYSWDNAGDYCTDIDSRLAKLEDSEEQTFIKEAVLKFRKLDGVQVWLGATDRHAEDTWTWVDDKRIATNLFTWVLGSPESGWNKKDCLAMSTEQKNYGKLVDLTCGQELHFVCKKNDTDSYTSTESSTTTSLTPTKGTTLTSPETLYGTTQQQQTQTLVPVLAMVATFFAVLSVVFIVLYLRQKKQGADMAGYYERHRPVLAGNEHMYQSYCESTASLSNAVYEQLDAPEAAQDAGNTKPEMRRCLDRGFNNDSAYVDVRTANSVNIWTVAK